MLESERDLGLGLTALAIFAGPFYLYCGHQTPTGQAPLADLNVAKLSELKNEFNLATRSSGSTAYPPVEFAPVDLSVFAFFASQNRAVAY